MPHCRNSSKIQSKDRTNRCKIDTLITICQTTEIILTVYSSNVRFISVFISDNFSVDRYWFDI